MKLLGLHVAILAGVLVSSAAAQPALPSPTEEPLAPPPPAPPAAVTATPPPPAATAPVAPQPYPTYGYPSGQAPVWGPVVTVPLDLTTATAGAGFELYHEAAKPGRDAPIARCAASCRIWVHPGRYRIQITETEDTVAGNRVLEVHGPMSIDFDPDTSLKRTGGLILGIAGPVMLISGIMLAVSDELDDPYDDDPSHDGSSNDHETEEAFGVLLIAGGLAATPIGWVMFGTSFKPEYQISRPLGSSPSAPPQPQWSFGPSVTGSGFGLSGTARF